MLGFNVADHRLDPITIAQELGFRRARSGVPVSGGADTAIWRVETEAGAVAVRVFRAEQERAAHRERQALAAAAEAGVPVPELLAAGAPDSASRRSVTVLGWCDGTTMADEISRRPYAAESLGELLGRTQAAIHRAAPPPDWDARAGDRLLHLDLHPLNVLVDGGRVTAVLDWVNANAGVPQADVARTYAILAADPGAVAVQRRDRRAARAFRRGWLAGYEDTAGRVGCLSGFIADAGAWMRRDLAPRLDDAALDRIDRWAAGWRRRAIAVSTHQSAEGA